MARQLGDSVQAWFVLNDSTTPSGDPPTFTLTKATHLKASAKLTDNATVTWSDQGEQVDVTALGDKNRVFLPGKGSVDISASFWYNLDDNPLMKSLVRGAKGLLIVRPNEGSAVGNVEFVGQVSVLGRQMGAQVNQGLPYDIQFVAEGDFIQQDIAVLST